jgi:hypothetical protein
MLGSSSRPVSSQASATVETTTRYTSALAAVWVPCPRACAQASRLPRLRHRVRPPTANHNVCPDSGSRRRSLRSAAKRAPRAVQEDEVGGAAAGVDAPRQPPPAARGRRGRWRRGPGRRCLRALPGAAQPVQGAGDGGCCGERESFASLVHVAHAPAHARAAPRRSTSRTLASRTTSARLVSGTAVRARACAVA